MRDWAWALLSRLCLYWITNGKGPFTLTLSLRSNTMVCRPDHGRADGPRVDVKEAAAWSRFAIPVTEAMLIASSLPVPHGVGNRASISSGHKRQPPQDMGDRDHVHHWVWAWLIEHFCSNLGGAWPPRTCLPRAIVPQSLHHGAFALFQAAWISTNIDSEQQYQLMFSPIPAVSYWVSAVTADVFTHSCRLWTGYCNPCSCKEAWQCIQGALRFFAVNICSYMCICVNILLCVYVSNFLYSRDLNMIFTGYSRYGQIFTICSCEYSKSIFDDYMIRYELELIHINQVETPVLLTMTVLPICTRSY